MEQEHMQMVIIGCMFKSMEEMSTVDGLPNSMYKSILYST